MRLILPIPPSVNHSHKNIRRGNRLMRIRSEETQQYMDDAKWMAIDWRNRVKWRKPDAKSKIILRIWIYWADLRRRDADNLGKVLLDSLTGVLYEDDRQVLPRVMDMNVDRRNPRVEIELEIMDEELAN